MAFVSIPKDLTRVQSKSLLGLTKKQIKGFGVAALLGGFTFFTTRISVGNTFALLLLMMVSIPFILYGIYEPSGLTVEQYLQAMFQFLFVSRGIRPYETENIYSILSKGSDTVETSSGNVPTAKTNRRKQQNYTATGGRTKKSEKRIQRRI